MGWHIDSSQKPSVRVFTSQALLKWHTFWIIDLEFSSGLLKQFMEDAEAFTEDVRLAETYQEVTDVSQHILAVLQVFNTVLSCLRSSSKSGTSSVSFLPPESTTWFDIVFQVRRTHKQYSLIKSLGNNCIEKSLHKCCQHFWPDCTTLWGVPKKKRRYQFPLRKPIFKGYWSHTPPLNLTQKLTAYLATNPFAFQACNLCRNFLWV